MNWRTPSRDPGCEALAEACGMPAPLVRVAWRRGCRTEGEVDRFLHPRSSELSDPFALKDLDRAVGRIWTAIDRRERIVVFGDYDVDGLTATALLVRALREFGAAAEAFLPHRVDDGYGLGEAPLRRCVEEFKPGLVVSVDCGTNSVEAVRWAAGRGIDVIVTDHHESSGEAAPACALVNPKFGAPESSRMLCGAGVAFNLCLGLLRRARTDGRPEPAVDLRHYLDLVALGTIADVVPLRDDNRILAHAGLRQMAKTRWAGLRALRAVAGLERDPESFDVGFVLGPRLNASGRLGTAEQSLRLLLTDDPDEAAVIAADLDRQNQERQQIERAMFEAAREMMRDFHPSRDFGLVVHAPDWHPGVVGIVASRLCSRFYRPVVVISEAGERCRGSGRSIDGFHLLDTLQECGSHLHRFGGHAMAAGLEIERANLAAFKAAFNEAARRRLGGREPEPVLEIESELGASEMDLDFIRLLQGLKPFGCENPEPVWSFAGARVLDVRPVGKDGRHLKFRFDCGGLDIDGIGWGLAERGRPEGSLDIAFALQSNTFRDMTRPQLVLKDFHPAGSR